MAIKIPSRNYLTAHELQARWECSENDLRYSIISQELKASILVDEELPSPKWKTHFIDGLQPVEPDNADFYTFSMVPRGWSYLQCPVQTGAFDCRFQLITDDRDPVMPAEEEDIPYTSWYWLPKPLVLLDVLVKGVFLLTEVANFELKHGTEEVVAKPTNSLGIREREYLHKLVVGMAIDGYGFDPAALKSPIPKQVAENLELLGLSITDDTVRKYLRQAADSVLPTAKKA